jgi:hypothetical protein
MPRIPERARWAAVFGAVDATQRTVVRMLGSMGA